MKIILSLLVLFFASTAFCDEDWTYLNRDEKVNKFQLSSKGKLQYDGQAVDNFSLQPKANRLAISPFSPDGKFAVVFSFGDQDSQCSIVQIDKRTASTVALEGTPVVWYSWSSGSYLLLSTYTDQDNALYAIGLADLQVRKIPIQLQKSGERTEFDTTTVTWNSPDTFEMEASIHCASCDSREEERIIRNYKLTVNAQTLEVKAEEQPLAPEE